MQGVFALSAWRRQHGARASSVMVCGWEVLVKGVLPWGVIQADEQGHSFGAVLAELGDSKAAGY